MTDMAVSRRCVWRNKIIKIIFSFFIAIGAIKNIAPFSIVHADSGTYYQLEANTCYQFINGGNYYIFDQDVRLTFVKNRYDTIDAWVVYNSNTLYYGSSSDSCPVSASTQSNTVTTTTTFSTTSIATSISQSDISSQFNSIVNDYVERNTAFTATYYTYGSLSVDPGPSLPSYGSIKELQYSTNIVGSGTNTGDSNIDTISWYPYWDTNDNISTTWNMEIQVVPGTWQGGTNTDIFSQSYQDFIINESGAMSIYHGTYLNGSYSISWGEVKNKLSILSWADLFQYFDGTYWNKKGWVYRARFNDPDYDYWSDWQTVYTVTSSSGEGVEKYIDPSDGTGLPGFYQDVEDSFNTTSIVNNNTNVTHIYTGIPMIVNIDDTETSEDITQIKKHVKQIRDILINLNTENSTTENNQNDQEITNNLNSVVGDLHTTEDEFMTDMDEKLNNIDRNVELLNDNKFIAAANWVRIQYDNVVSDTPFELLIVFGLVLSLALIIIGKIR